MTISFAGKVAIVTGAGAGLGRSHALELARRGAKVVVNDLGGSVDGSGEAIANGASVADKIGAQSIVKDALAAFGTVDILINNAGVLRDKTFKKMELADLEVVLNVHLLGSAYVTHAVWPIMLDKGYGRIVMTTSSSGLYGNFGQSNYGAAKLGVVGLMNTLKLEGARNNVHVNTIAPIAATRMTEGIGIPAAMFERLKPELVTPAVLYLASEQAPSGTIIEAGAGYYAKVQIVEAKGVKLGDSVSVDDVAAHWAEITDMSAAQPLQQGGDVTRKIFT
jgi:NAD(P)-dependent dehydrogenase (short-subunit alcohol dehydrogenase family)